VVSLDTAADVGERVTAARAISMKAVGDSLGLDSLDMVAGPAPPDGATVGSRAFSCTPGAVPDAARGNRAITCAPSRPMWHVVQLDCAWQFAHVAMFAFASAPWRSANDAARCDAGTGYDGGRPRTRRATRASEPSAVTPVSVAAFT
jgi:hypothetical protein